jgi:hypothetical protein
MIQRKVASPLKNIFAKMKTIASEIATTGKPLRDDELIWSILPGLGDSYNTLKATIRANPNTTLTNLFSHLHAFDQLHKVDDGGVFISSANMAHRGNDPPPRGGGGCSDDRGRRNRHDDCHDRGGLYYGHRDGGGCYDDFRDHHYESMMIALVVIMMTAVMMGATPRLWWP